MRKPKDEAEKKAISNIKKYGLHIMHIMEDENNPQFSYSIGLYENYLHPEIIIIGLRHELAKVLLNNMAHDIKNGKIFTIGEYHEDVLDNFLCYFGEVSKSQYQDNVGWARWFYEGDNFPLIQCVYPTVKGKFPWDKDFPEEARFYCKLLTKSPKEH
jgi:hypothetical protein